MQICTYALWSIKISYKFSDLTYGAIEAYRDRCFYDINPLQRQYVNKALNKIENTYEHFARENGNSINHYINNHGHVPIWVISEYLTFGVIINFYRGLDPIIREQIAIQLSIFVRKNLGIDINDLKAISLSPKQITLTMTNIKDIRNLLAHRSLLFNAKLQYMYPKYNFVNFNKSNDNNSRKTVFDTIMVLRLFLSINEYNSMIKEISEVTNELKESITSIDCYKILVTLGFPKEFN